MVVNTASDNKRKVYRDKYSSNYVEIERVDENNIRIYYSNGYNQVLGNCVLEYYEEVEEVEDLSNYITGLERMLYLAVKHYLQDRVDNPQEDHHAILNIMDILQCSRSFAEILVKKLIKDKLVIDTGEFK